MGKLNKYQKKLKKLLMENGYDEYFYDGNEDFVGFFEDDFDDIKTKQDAINWFIEIAYDDFETFLGCGCSKKNCMESLCGIAYSYKKVLKELEKMI